MTGVLKVVLFASRASYYTVGPPCLFWHKWTNAGILTLDTQLFSQSLVQVQQCKSFTSVAIDLMLTVWSS